MKRSNGGVPQITAQPSHAFRKRSTASSRAKFSSGINALIAHVRTEMIGSCDNAINGDVPTGTREHRFSMAYSHP
jgi:hypothetical protein